MTISRSEDLLVGIIAFGALAWIVWILVRGVRDRQLPIGKSRIASSDRPGAFQTLFVFYVGAGLMMGFIALDLIFGIAPRS